MPQYQVYRGHSHLPDHAPPLRPRIHINMRCLSCKLLCDEEGMRPKVQQTCAFTDEGVQAAFHALNPPPGERRGATGKIVVEIIPAAVAAS